MNCGCSTYRFAVDSAAAGDSLTALVVKSAIEFSTFFAVRIPIARLGSLVALGSALTGPAALAQTRIGTSTPNASTRLAFVAANKRIWLPKIYLHSTTDATTIAFPATSLLVWNTNAALPNGTGYYYNAGTPSLPKWVKLLYADSNVQPADNGPLKTGTNVQLGGPLTSATSVTNNDFSLNLAGSPLSTTFASSGHVGIGTTNRSNRQLHISGTEAMRIDDSGNAGIGAPTPAVRLDVS